MARWKLAVCDTCGASPCECAINGTIKRGANAEHWDNRNYDPFTPVDEGEPSVEELLAIGQPAAA